MEKRVVRNKCILGIQVNILRTLEDILIIFHGCIRLEKDLVL